MCACTLLPRTLDCQANNAPLKGGKFADFEGGVRVNAFVSGGVVAPSLRGRTIDTLVHIADWYGTLCAAAGVSDFDDEVRYPTNTTSVTIVKSFSVVALALARRCSLSLSLSLASLLLPLAITTAAKSLLQLTTVYASAIHFAWQAASAHLHPVDSISIWGILNGTVVSVIIRVLV